MAETPISSAGVIIYRYKSTNKSIEYLLLKKTGDIWEPPKGRIDPGEETFDAAFRETREEANLSFSELQLENDFQPVLVQYKRENRKLKTAKFWLARANESAIVTISSEHEEFRWCDLSEVVRIIRFGMAEGFLKVDAYLRDRDSMAQSSSS